MKRSRFTEEHTHAIWEESKAEWLWLNEIFYAYHDVHNNTCGTAKKLFSEFSSRAYLPLITMSYNCHFLRKEQSE